jgi:hypothetical protein
MRSQCGLAGLLMCPLYQSIKLNLELTSSPFLMCNISEKGRLGAIQDLILIRLRLYPNLPEETRNTIGTQESEVLSIIRHRWAPRR